ncbi:MAG: UvrB/UvrC motif-containing protein [Brevinema sp.]
MSEDMFIKPCDICGAQPAVLMFRTFNGEKIGDEGLCPKCALERFTKGGMIPGLDSSEVLTSISEMRNILTEIASHLQRMTEENSNGSGAALSVDACSVCGQSAKDIQRLGTVGCSNCYQQFTSEIRERLVKSAYGSRYQGIIPNRFRKAHFRDLELEQLKIKLNALVRSEKYEMAAKVRNRIQKLLRSC